MLFVFVAKKTKLVDTKIETKTATLDYRILESSEGGESHSDEPYSSREPIYVQFRGVQIRKSKDDSFFVPDSIEADKSYLDETHLFVVRVQYRTGDSFVTTYGKSCVAAIKKTKEEAIKEKNEIEEEYEEYRDGKKVKFSREWIGYFERLESVNIELVELKD